MICPNCHTPNRNSAKFCDECGYELPSIMPTASVRDAMPAASAYDELESASTIDLDGGKGCDDGAPTVPFGATSALASQPTAIIKGADDPAFTGEIPLIGDEALGARDYRVEDGYSASGGKARSRMSGKRIGILAAVIALLLLAAFAITYSAQFWGGRTVPDVVGLSQVDATYAVQEAGFTVQVEEVTSDEVEGIVLSTDPAGGTRVPEKTTVTLRVSVARFIPEIKGKPLEEAESLMREAGFTNFEVIYEKSDAAPDTVLDVSPAGTTRAKADARITIKVAEPFRVPDVAGKTRDEAQAALEAEGFAAAMQLYNTEEVPEGQVVKTDPAAGSALASGSTVTVYVAHNRSAELVGLTRGFFEDSSTITMDGSLYEMSKVDSVTFQGGNTCAFSITVRPIQTVTWFGTQTETRYGNYQVVNGTIVWTDANQIASIDPSIKQGS